jgi:hypothetical protein
MHVGSAQGPQQGNSSGHPLGGPPGQMWKQALSEAGGESGAWIPPGQRKKMQNEQAAQGQAPQGAGATVGTPLGQPPIGSGEGNIFQGTPQLA